MKKVTDLKVKNQTVLVRVDFNVPLKDGVITDDNRMVAALPTIQELLKKEAKVVLMSHLGKIDFKKEPEEIAKAKKKSNMAYLHQHLQELLPGVNVRFVDATRGEVLKAAVEALKAGEVLLVQNTRYEKGESKNDPELAAEWAGLVDAFVMDAFGSAHRAHASTYGVPEVLKAQGKPVAIGFLVEKEVQNLTRCVEVAPKDRPYVAILGGLKVSDKIKVIESLVKKCDKILIGGAMAFTFKRALGFETGESPVEEDRLEFAKQIFEEAKGKIILPVDSVETDAFEGYTVKRVVKDNITPGHQGMDIGPETQKLFEKELQGAKMVFWNGPMGVFEQDEFAKGTEAVCKAIAHLPKCFAVIGGGDSASAAAKLGYKDRFAHVSTGGGASLEMIENDGHLPGIDIIRG